MEYEDTDSDDESKLVIVDSEDSLAVPPRTRVRVRSAGAREAAFARMRKLNNEASKRSRLKRRIKQDSLEKTRQLLESHQVVLGNRVTKLHKIKEILNDACRSIWREDHVCECLSFYAKIKKILKEMADFPDISNHEIIKRSRMVRDTNLEEILGSSSTEISDMRPLKRGQEAAPGFTINTDLRSIKPDSPATAVWTFLNLCGK